MSKEPTMSNNTTPPTAPPTVPPDPPAKADPPKPIPPADHGYVLRRAARLDAMVEGGAS